MRQKAFTLIELLVVIAIIAILAAILFPVFAQAKASARKAKCMSNFRQCGMAVMQYCADRDDRMPHANQGSHPSGWGFGRPDMIWCELVMPYMNNWEILRCPDDPEATDQGLSKDPFGRPMTDRSNPNFYYYWAERADFGINYDFLTPWIYRWKTDRYVGSEPITMSLIERPADTILAADSIWDRNSQTGRPFGAGNWVVEAPCVRDSDGNLMVPTSDPQQWASYGGWRPNPTGMPPYSWLEFGGCWPRHGKNLMVNFCDGHAKNLPLGRIVAGCDVKPSFGGAAYDGDLYLWDLR